VRARTARTLAWTSFVISTVLSVGTAVFIVLAWNIPVLRTEFGFKGYTIPFSLALGIVGAILASRVPSNAIGWIFCALAILSAFIGLTTEYARWALIHQGGRPPLALESAWLQEWIWVPLLVGLGLVAWIFPDGSFLSRRWKMAALVGVALGAIPMVANAMPPHLTIFAGYPNPLHTSGAWIPDLANTSVLFVTPILVGGALSASVRFRRGHGDERQQIKWLLLSVSALGAAIAVYVVTLITGADINTGFGDVAMYIAIGAFIGIPVSIGVAILRYRLYDVDLVLNKAVVYGAIAVFITVVYLVIVIGVGSLIGYASNPVLSAIAAAIVALAFQPARRWAQRLANRVVYGKRATPYEVLADLGERLASEYATEDVLDRIAVVVADGVGAHRAVVWLLADHELRPAAVRPVGASAAAVIVDDDRPPTEAGDLRVFPILHQGALLGAIGVEKPANDPLTAPDEKLVGDLAAQAGLVVRNVRLIEDLRASRRRLVAAQDEERRRLERNIHDGAQQQLVALSVKARLTQQMIERDPEKARDLAAQIQAETTAALEDLRDLARGIYPPLLADEGLVAALLAQARKAAVPVAVDGDGVGRFERDVEAGVYFCVLEALNNVAKYANASRVDVRLSNGDGRLAFEVSDDGSGFDVSAGRFGTGLRGMQDRLEALGGTLEIRSEPNTGTNVAGSVPVTGAAR
jgi:signal transduction histidine kinase